MSSVTAERPPLTFPIKLAYGFGTLAFGVKATLMGLLLFYYNQIVGLPPVWVSVGLAATVLFDAFWDPAIGQISDNWRSKWGRRHPFMYFAAVPSAVTLWALFNPPDLPDLWVTVYMVVMVILAKSTISMYEVPATALTPELAPEYHERTQLLSYRYFFAIFSGSAAAVIGFLFFLRDTVGPDGERIRGQLNEAGYPPYSLVVGAVMILSIMVACIATHKFIPFLHQPPVRRPKILAIIKEMAVTMSNRNFLIVTLSALFVGIGGGLGQGLNIYFQTYFWGLGSRDLALIYAGPMISSLAALFIAPWVSRVLGKKRGCVTVLALGLVVSLLPISLRLMEIIPLSWNGTGQLTILLFIDRVFAGAMATSGAIMTASMIADVVEESQLSTGRRSEGLLLSADNVLQKIAASISGIIPGVLLAWVGMPQRARPETLDPQIMTNLALIYLPATATFSVLAIASLIFYRIDKATHEENLRRLQDAAALAEQRVESGDMEAPDTLAPSPRPL